MRCFANQFEGLANTVPYQTVTVYKSQKLFLGPVNQFFQALNMLSHHFHPLGICHITGVHK